MMRSSAIKNVAFMRNGGGYHGGNGSSINAYNFKDKPSLQPSSTMAAKGHNHNLHNYGVGDDDYYYDDHRYRRDNYHDDDGYDDDHDDRSNNCLAPRHDYVFDPIPGRTPMFSSSGGRGGDHGMVDLVLEGMESSSTASSTESSSSSLTQHRHNEHRQSQPPPPSCPRTPSSSSGMAPSDSTPEVSRSSRRQRYRGNGGSDDVETNASVGDII